MDLFGMLGFLILFIEIRLFFERFLVTHLVTGDVGQLAGVAIYDARHF